MLIIDRYIITRFLVNFVILFALLFIFAISIDVIVQLERFLDAADEAVEQGRYPGRLIGFLAAIIDFHGPRLFQFYAYMLGLLCVGAMGFTLAQMHRNRELVAMLSVGLSLGRVAIVIMLVAAGLNVLQMINQEVMLPKLAPMLIREHRDILSRGMSTFEVMMSRDQDGDLLLADTLEPETGTLSEVLILERNPLGTAQRRITAPKAIWDDQSQSWQLENGIATIRTQLDTEASMGTVVSPVETVTEWKTDLSPNVLIVRQSAQYGQMLSLRQIKKIRQEGGVDSRQLSRYSYSRLAGILVNLLVLLIALPSFLLREPSNLLHRSIVCAGLAIPILLGSFLGMTMEVPGLSAGLSVFLPVAILIPLAIGRLTMIRT